MVECNLSMFGLFGARNQMLGPSDNLIRKFIILNYCIWCFTSTAADILFSNVNLRYLKSSFVIDLLFCLPWDIIYQVFLFCFQNCINTSHHLLARFLKVGLVLLLSTCMKVSAINKVFFQVLVFLIYSLLDNSSPAFLISLHHFVWVGMGKKTRHCYRIIKHEKIDIGIIILNILWKLNQFLVFMYDLA